VTAESYFAESTHRDAVSHQPTSAIAAGRVTPNSTALLGTRLLSAERHALGTFAAVAVPTRTLI